MKIQGTDYVYDYSTDECVPESDMPIGGERWKASEKIKWESIQKSIDKNDQIN